MDFSRLHMYTPPQCVPENTGYTYALSSSYSSDALAFETEHRLDPVFDSPRMSRRSLRLVTTACATEDGQARDTHSCSSSTASLKDRAARTVKQRRSASKPAFSINHTSRKVVSCGVGQSGTSTLSSAACLRPPVLDESLIREQTKVDHFWGLDDDGDLKGGNKAATQGNGDLAAEAARSNGYTCSDCLLLSERKDTLTAHSATHGPSPRLYSRDQGQKRKAASGIFWWLGIGWYQFVTLISWLNVFLLTRCLRNICKFLILLIPLLLLLGGGLSLWGQGDFLSGLPVFNWTRIYGTQRVDSPESMFTPDASQLSQDGEAFHEHRMSEVERQMTSLSGQCHSHEEKLRELATVLQTLQARVDQMDGDGEATLSLVQRVVGQHLKEISADGLSDSQTDTVTFRQEHELRLSNLEDILGKLTQTSEAIQKELEQTKLRTASGAEEEQRLLSVVKHLEEELGHLKSELSSWQHLKTSCEEVDTIHGKVDAQVRETVKLMFSDGEQGGSLKWLLQTVSSQFVSRDDLQVLLRDLELQILKNITHYISVTKQVPDSETVVSAANEAGISGITEAQARVIVNNALKLYSQDKTGMVDFALESGGGSILSTRCSETYETKTALISLFGIPLWYFSQSPRVVIQPDIHPGNCWAFRGSQGYLVVRLSMKIRPTAFTLEHIPKTLSPTGNITSAPKDFAVYGLEDEYQEEGQLLGQFTYDQEGESLQMFHVPKRPEGAFQIVELRIFSNWGHPEYTCLYRFRVHGEPIK
ncbi:SUN domain-containing protein 1 isoform X9 [Canis lupus familiaris]|uniref:Sad1 and UNC84 domain containing 1 n=1 Tax=Canis lupus familiaris TaxID=9615 RepID=A0A8I3NCT0_CANLF|nr:SUN domain-containing protein 1 isoform X13 [Canis lupus dingo]XP_038395640.1 SUN domain-containing protein 1 isoform X9 [Canis lupus familiaris]XP_038524443.1 SUN domain-containing protein 1 isoform X9 [Canis lupus familiaris]